MRPWSHWLGLRHPQGEILHATTRDGVRLAIHRVKPLGTREPRPAVMLLHGLGANRFAFMYPGRSLAEWLAARGFDCYVPELRGAGHSETPSVGWDVEDYLALDLPAILEAIRHHSGQEHIHWVGHSLGGILMMCHAIRTQGAHLARGCAVGSALDYRHGKSGFRGIYGLRQWLQHVPRLPFGPGTHLIAPLLARLDTPIERFNFWPTNVEPEVVRRIHANAFGWIPTRLMLSLASVFEEGGLCSRDGTVRYLQRLSAVEQPMALFAGSGDVQCPVEAVEQTARAAGDGRIHVERFGTAYGHVDEYGHFDLLVGKRAPEEVWPRLQAWLSPVERPVG